MVTGTFRRIDFEDLDVLYKRQKECEQRGHPNGEVKVPISPRDYLMTCPDCGATYIGQESVERMVMKRIEGRNSVRIERIR